MDARLHVIWRRRGYGFDGLPFEEVAGNVTQTELAQLLWVRPITLQETPLASGPQTEPAPSSALRPQLEQLRRKTSWAREASTSLDDLDVTTLTDLYGRLLWFKAERGLEEEWRRQHPQEARMLRVLKGRIRARRGGEAIRISWEPQRGKLVLVRRSRTRSRPMSVTEIVRVSERGWFRSGLSGVVESLRVGMRPESDHGAYCRLMDLLRAVVILCSLGDEPQNGGGGRPEGDRVEGWKRILREKAAEILEADLRRRPAGWIGHDPGVRQAWADIAADWIPRKVGLGRTEWSDLTLDSIIARVMPEAKASGTLPLHRDGINYLVRRILNWFRRKGRRWFDR